MSNQETGLTLTKENALNNVMAKIETLKKETGIVLPKNYSAANAINSAWLKLQEVKDNNKKLALEVCSKNSIIETLYNMVLQGLSPAKDQCYFVVFAGKLQLMKSYLGNIAATKRLKGVIDVVANVIYQGDDFKYSIDPGNGRMKIEEHKQEFDNIDDEKIRGAYAIVILENQDNFVEMMTFKQIQKAWAMGYSAGGKTHTDFAGEMCKKTVINRACKHFTKTSDDSDALLEVVNKTYEYDEKDIVESTHEEVKEEIKQNANQEVIDIPVEEVKAEEVGPNPNNGMTKQMEMGDEPF
ncbi:RecT family recombinase [Clostridium butyricum]|uniref:RecT family recombinase n=1 Tax=Clostridium butyricum TaxID=1492 RepID=UPI00071E9F27|nr:RecT family recombinase [Clostridium butyricum]ALR90252.1 recombinase RecT [Clostridium butyricum]ALS19137.1 recombinase RecT [Clostridium butyricum]ANF16324.1 recombinase RecT [Clostridium butyricum]AOR96236.1 recombinase RecT [Clostridium butyricum]MCI3010217.1 recombinase RecT [Clostridium butyricum]